jgi:hypothetical protein
MQYIDVRIRVPITKLGQFIQVLPSWAPMIGYDKLEEQPIRKYAPRVSNGEYKPARGSTVAVVLRRLTQGPMLPRELMAALKSHKKQAINSAIGGLVKRGLVIRQKDGTYAAKD